jgi:acyl dehydratase
MYCYAVPHTFRSNRRERMLRWDRSLIGQEFSRWEQHVTRETILEYAAIIGATAPVYTDPQAAQARGYRDIIAPPTFVTWHGGQPIVPPAMGFTGTGINAGYACTFYEVVYPGDILTYSTCLIDMYEKTGRSGTMRFVVRETTVTNQHADVVAVLRNPFILGW